MKSRLTCFLSIPAHILKREVYSFTLPQEVVMKTLRQRMMEDMQLHGLAERTRQSYAEAVKKLSEYYGKPPDSLSEEDIRNYFLYLLNEKQVARSSMVIYLIGIKFFYEKTLQRKWTIFGLILPKKQTRLPVVFSRNEVALILPHVHNVAIRLALQLAFACGLRISELRHVKVADIDGERQQLRVNGKGNKVRELPLPDEMLSMLRAYYRLHRPSYWLFPGKKSDNPICTTSLQRAFKAALQESGIKKPGTVHSLRHSYATAYWRTARASGLFKCSWGIKVLQRPVSIPI